MCKQKGLFMDMDNIGKRYNYVVQFDRLSDDGNYMLLRHVINTDKRRLTRDHMWIRYTKKWKKLLLDPGAIIRFNAKLNRYKKKDVIKSTSLTPLYLYNIGNDDWMYTLKNVNDVDVIFQQSLLIGQYYV